MNITNLLSFNFRKTTIATALLASLGVAGVASAAVVAYDFENLAAGTSYSSGDVLQVIGAEIQVLSFQLGGGAWVGNGSATVVQSNRARGSQVNELQLDHSTIRVIPENAAIEAEFAYAEYGGNVNFGVNGDFRNVGDLADLDSTVVGNCGVFVTENAITFAGVQIGVRGTVRIVPLIDRTIERFGFGGRALFVDDVVVDQ